MNLSESAGMLILVDYFAWASTTMISPEWLARMHQAGSRKITEELPTTLGPT